MVDKSLSDRYVVNSKLFAPAFFFFFPGLMLVWYAARILAPDRIESMEAALQYSSSKVFYYVTNLAWLDKRRRRDRSPMPADVFPQI